MATAIPMRSVLEVDPANDAHPEVVDSCQTCLDNVHFSCHKAGAIIAEGFAYPNAADDRVRDNLPG